MCKASKRIDKVLVGLPASVESVIQGKKHLKIIIRHQSGDSRILVTGKTPSCGRAHLNESAQIKRLVRDMGCK